MKYLPVNNKVFLCVNVTMETKNESKDVHSL